MENKNTPEIRLTEFAHGAGCGCKIAPAVLSAILANSGTSPQFKDLLVGSEHNDDAAVLDLGNGQALISTTDFFMPIVDDAYMFGQVAAANAISDVYAMGGSPVLALAILGWPVEKLPAALASKVVEGARNICSQAGIPLAGGHSIDTPEPMFGLSVNGLVNTRLIKKNSDAKEKDLIYLTKPLGSGILSTASKRKLLAEKDLRYLVNEMTRLNKVGTDLAKIPGVHAMTDVTGFGLLGHLIEICKASRVNATLQFSSIPLMENLDAYISKSIVPDATYRNWNAYQNDLHVAAGVDAGRAFITLPDPQTNGGLLFTAGASARESIHEVLKKHGLENFARPIGEMHAGGEKMVTLVE